MEPPPFFCTTASNSAASRLLETTALGSAHAGLTAPTMMELTAPFSPSSSMVSSPPSPFQPDGTPFGSGGGVSTLLDVAYDAGSDSLALSWTNQRGKEYQVPYSATGIAPWTNIGLSFPADGSGTNSETLNALGLPGGTYIFRVLELDP